MPRPITLAAAQMGPVARTESRAAVVRRMVDLMRQAAGMGAQVVAFPEACLTAFFPHWWSEDEDEIDAVRRRVSDSLTGVDALDRGELGFA